MTGPVVPSDEERRELVARCDNRIEPSGTPCPGLLRYRWGQIEAACDTCGGRCGIAVASWLTVATDGTDVALADRERYADQRAAEEIERLADERTWTTQHDNEVVSTRDLYEQVARLRGELDPVTYDFPPDAALTAREEAGR